MLHTLYTRKKQNTNKNIVKKFTPQNCPEMNLFLPLKIKQISRSSKSHHAEQSQWITLGSVERPRTRGKTHLLLVTTGSLYRGTPAKQWSSFLSSFGSVKWRPLSQVGLYMSPPTTGTLCARKTEMRRDLSLLNPILLRS